MKNERSHSQEAIDKVTSHSVITLASAKSSDARALSNISLLAFQNATNTPAFFPDRVGLSPSELIAKHSLPVSRRMERRIVGDYITIKASIKSADAEEKIIGFAIWSSPSKARLVRRTFWEWFLLRVVHPIQKLFRISIAPGLPRPKKDLITAQFEATFSTGGIAEGLKKPWYLHLLAVHPTWQGIGVGRKLLEWGLEMSSKENSPVYLESSPEAFNFYVASGFTQTMNLTCVANGTNVSLPGMIWIPKLKSASQTMT